MVCITTTVLLAIQISNVYFYRLEVDYDLTDGACTVMLEGDAIFEE